MNRLRLHSYWRSSAAYRVRLALEYKGLPFDYLPVHLLRGGGEQFGADYLRINPQSRVPALEVDGEVLTQSMAILEWLEEQFPDTPRLLPGQRARARAGAQPRAADRRRHPAAAEHGRGALPARAARLLRRAGARTGCANGSAAGCGRWSSAWIASRHRPLLPRRCADPRGRLPGAAVLCVAALRRRSGAVPADRRDRRGLPRARGLPARGAGAAARRRDLSADPAPRAVAWRQCAASAGAGVPAHRRGRSMRSSQHQRQRQAGGGGQHVEVVAVADRRGLARDLAEQHARSSPGRPAARRSPPSASPSTA